MRCKLALLPGLPTIHILIASTFYVLEAIENWTMGGPGNNANANQVCSIILPHHTTE